MQLPTAPFNGVSQYLFPYKVNKALFQTWFPLTHFASLTSEDMSKPVYKHTMRPGEGTQFRVGKIEALDYKNPVLDTQQKRGFAQTQTVHEDQIDTSRYSWPVLCRDLDLMASGTPIDSLPSKVTKQLTDVQHQNFSDSMFKAATWGNYGTGSAAPSVIGAMPSVNRAVAGEGGYLYNATATLAEQLETALVANAQLSVKHLRILKLMAQLGGTVMGNESPVRPSSVTLVNGQNSTEYYYFAHPNSITDLLNDADFKSFMVGRIGVESQPQPISGADYIGKIFGINIYECPMISEYYAPITIGNCAWNILIGAGAWTVGWYKFPSIVVDQDVIENSSLYCSHEQRGQKCLKFAAKSVGTMIPGYQTVEQGIIHSFVRI